MVPPTWLDERGRPHAKRPRPTCGREIPDLTIPSEHLKWYKWETLPGLGNGGVVRASRRGASGADIDSPTPQPKTEEKTEE
jgi:hypothetical protein